MRTKPFAYTLVDNRNGEKVHWYGKCLRCGDAVQAKKSKYCWNCFMASKPQPVERFWKYVNKTSGCWLWTGAVAGSNFYGNFWNGKRYISTHRFSWILHNGEVPKSLYVLHKCDVPRCVRPDHLFLGTLLDNARDRVAKGRAIGPHHKLTDNDVRKIKEMRKNGMKATDIAVAFNVHRHTITNIVSGRLWKHIV